MKIINIYIILLTKSLKVFSPISAKFYMNVHGTLSNSHGIWLGFPDATPVCTTTLLGGLEGCWNVQRLGTLRQIEKKRAQPSSGHTNLNR